MYQWVLTQYIGISILIFVCLNLFLATVVVCSSTWDALHQGITGQRGLVERYSAYTGWIGIPRTLILWDLPFQWLLYNDAKRHFRQIHPCLSSFERTNEKLCRKRTIPPESANRKIEGTRQSKQCGFSIYIFDNSKSMVLVRLVRADKMVLSGLVFAWKIARMILIQNV